MVMHALPTPAMEEEADRFASEFLMPSDEINPYLVNVTLDKLASLKKHWKVAMSTILIKTRDLEKITDRQYRTLWEKIGKAGYRLQEPKELEIPLEKPSLLQEILTAHFGDLQYSPEQLSEKLMLDPMEFYSLYSVPLQSQRLRLVSNLR